MGDSLCGDGPLRSAHGVHLVEVLLRTIGANCAVAINHTVDELHVDFAALSVRKITRAVHGDLKPDCVSQRVDVANELVQDGGGEMIDEVGEKDRGERRPRATGGGRDVGQGIFQQLDRADDLAIVRAALRPH